MVRGIEEGFIAQTSRDGAEILTCVTQRAGKWRREDRVTAVPFELSQGKRE